MSLFNELKRRSVFRTGGAYLLLMWAILQVTDIVAPGVGLPEWTITVFIVVTVIGFPIVLLLTWVYDITPDGLVRADERDTSVISQRPVGAGRWVEVGVFFVLLVAVSYLLVDKLMLTKSTIEELSEGRRSIAVLPFENLSGDETQQYFSDGVTEEILNSLAGIRDLRVTSRTSAFSLRDSKTSIREIGELLGVEYVLEGSVRRSEANIRVTAQLVRTADDVQLWSQTYDRVLSATNILGIQEDVATAVTDQLQVRILPDERLVNKVPANIEALDLYLDGMTYIRQIITTRNISDSIFTAAIDRFEASIEIDPDWAPSRYGLGVIWHLWLPPRDYEDRWQKSYEQIEKALEIDPDYDLAWGSMVFLHTVKRDFEAALEAAENLTDKTLGARLVLELEDYESATAYYRELLARDPLSEIAHFQLSLALVCSGRFNEAIAEIETVLENSERRGMPSFILSPPLAYAYAKQGDFERALAIAESLPPDGPLALTMAPIYALAGDAEKAEYLLQRMEAEDQQPRPAHFGAASVILGQPERALSYFESSLPLGGAVFGNFRCSEEVRSLQSNPRMQAVLEKIGIPPEFRNIQ